MENHRLRREIIATAVTNSMVNRMGSTFLQRMQEDTGETPAQIAKAYSVSREVLDARWFWAGIDELDLKATEASQIAALTALWHLQRNMTRWLLNRPGDIVVIASMVERYAEPLKALREALPKILPASSRASLQADRAQWQQQGFTAELALAMACVPYLTYGLDIVEVALERRLAGCRRRPGLFRLVRRAAHQVADGQRREASGRWALACAGPRRVAR